MSELTDLTVAEAAPLIRRRKVSPIELTEACLARIERLEPALNAFVTVTGDAARAAAAEAERLIARGGWLGPLHGVPVAIKDLCATRGVRTTAGSKVLADNVPDFDATVVARLKAAGAVIVGKTNMHEFAYGGTNEISHFGPSRNPWDPSRIAGGSSGGSGSAVAARMVPVAIGSDTGGSIRIPASACGIAGIKPTYGRVSRHGVIPLSWSLDHLGPMTRSVEDLAITLAAIAGPELDPTTLDLPSGAFWPLRREAPSTYRLAVDACSGYAVDPQVADGLRAAARAFTELGAVTEEVSLPYAEDSFVAWKTIMTAEATAWHEPLLASAARADYAAEVRIQLEAGRHVTAPQYLKAQRFRTFYAREIAAILAGFDAVLMPSLPIAATPIGQRTVRVGDREITVQDAVTFANCVANMTGRPAVSVPCGLTAEGLPIGLTILGHPGQEARILSIAAAYEAATDWHRRAPELPTGGAAR